MSLATVNNWNLIKHITLNWRKKGKDAKLRILLGKQQNGETTKTGKKQEDLSWQGKMKKLSLGGGGEVGGNDVPVPAPFHRW
jgi:hypothetical protein